MFTSILTFAVLFAMSMSAGSAKAQERPSENLVNASCSYGRALNRSRNKSWIGGLAENDHKFPDGEYLGLLVAGMNKACPDVW